MRIELNGEPLETADGTTITGLLSTLKLASRQVAVEVNRQLVPRQQHAERVLCDGDQLEIVTLAGGG